MKYPGRSTFAVTNLLVFGLIAASLFGIENIRAQSETNRGPVAGGGEYKIPRGMCLSDAKRAEIYAQVNENVARLTAEGRLPVDSPMFLPPSFIFPVRANAGALNDYGVHYDAGGVDHDPLFPNQLKDYNCGTRTYDWENGYNHLGTDIGLWPFYWNKMDRDEAAVVAAAAGILVFRDDGYPDRSCAPVNINDVNTVVIKHSDGSFAQYAHLKKHSVTGKLIGSYIAQGEYLGIAGSSGGSYVPHLHFEVVNSAIQPQDPYQGPCNMMNANSYWQNQAPYYDSKINKLMTHSAPPVFPTCPNPEIENAKNVFQPGEQLFLAAYYRSNVAGQVSEVSVIQPSGETHSSWSHTSPNTYVASYWYWNYNLPADAAPGTWKFRVVYQSQTYEHPFTVLAPYKPQFDFDGDRQTDISVFRPSAGEWWYVRSSDSQGRAIQFGNSSDKLTPADFTGDAKTDISVWRPGTGEWFVIRSEDSTFYSFPFGATGDTPVLGDFDGDNKADAAVFRPSNATWYIHRSSDSGTSIQQFGVNTDAPVPADYDADGKTDIAVFRASAGEWWIQQSSSGVIALQFGVSTDKAVPSDYTGDGKTDVAFWRPASGEWFVLRSEDFSYYSSPFGTSGDLPSVGDYDGDAKSDIAVFRPSNATWYLNRSNSGLLIRSFGQTGDVPVPSLFIP